MAPPAPGGHPTDRPLAQAGGMLLIALAFWICASGGRLLAHYGVVTAVWPPSGLGVALLTLLGLRMWPGVLLGEILAVTVAPPPAELPITLPAGAVLTMGVGSALEAVIGAALLRRYARFDGCIDSFRKAVVLLLIPFLACSVSATLGNLALVPAGGTTWATFPHTWWTWWVGNALGVIVVTPFVFAVTTPFQPSHRRWWRLEGTALLALGAFVASYAMFGAFPDAPRATREVWLMYPFVVWAALRFGPHGSAAAVFLVGLLALGATTLRLQGAPAPTLADTILRVQVFMGVMGASVLLIAAGVAERRRAWEALVDLNSGLEAEVARRTAELRSANRTLAARNAELATINLALDRFVADVSHDLRVPVRAVAGFSELLRSEHGGELGLGGTALVDRILAAAARMGRLIDRLLELSRVGRTALRLQEVDVDGLVRDVIAELDIGRSELRVLDLPGCQADPALLGAVFANLIQNAVKYSREAGAPRIEVGGESGPDFVRYWVRDNGVGFDPAAASELFRPFTRLHSGFEGSGIGLAIVRRILDAHGGRVWAESQPGEGATFWFEVPILARGA